MAPLWDLLAEIGEFTAGGSWWDEGFAANVTAKAAEAQALFAEYEDLKKESR